MSYILKLKSKLVTLVDARNISPDKFVDKNLHEIRNLKLFEGSMTTTLDTIFDVEGSSSPHQNVRNIEIIIEGECSKLNFVGYKMNGGKIVVKGDIGHFLGYKMKGGNIVVYGNTRNYTGAKMVDGSIEIYGNAGHRTGSKLHGEKPGKGMRGGTIYVHGNSGSEVGWGMGGGTIIIDGDSGNLVGANMTGGTVIVKRNCGMYVGLRMISGRIVVGSRIQSLLPSFYIDSLIPSVKVKGVTFSKPFAVFIGDVLSGGRGFLQISYEDNKHIVDEYVELLRESV